MSCIAEVSERNSLMNSKIDFKKSSLVNKNDSNLNEISKNSVKIIAT